MKIYNLPNNSRLIICFKTFFGLRIGVNCCNPFVKVERKCVFELDFFILRLWINIY